MSTAFMRSRSWRSSRSRPRSAARSYSASVRSLRKPGYSKGVPGESQAQYRAANARTCCQSAVLRNRRLSPPVAVGSQNLPSYGASCLAQLAMPWPASPSPGAPTSPATAPAIARRAWLPVCAGLRHAARHRSACSRPQPPHGHPQHRRGRRRVHYRGRCDREGHVEGRTQAGPARRRIHRRPGCGDLRPCLCVASRFSTGSPPTAIRRSAFSCSGRSRTAGSSRISTSSGRRAAAVFDRTDHQAERRGARAGAGDSAADVVHPLVGAQAQRQRGAARGFSTRKSPGPTFVPAVPRRPSAAAAGTDGTSDRQSPRAAR